MSYVQRVRVSVSRVRLYPRVCKRNIIVDRLAGVYMSGCTQVECRVGFVVFQKYGIRITRSEIAISRPFPSLLPDFEDPCEMKITGTCPEGIVQSRVRVSSCRLVALVVAGVTK